MDWDKYRIVGTSQKVFKDYLRLTTVSILDFWLPSIWILQQEPDPKDIRPLSVLKKTLAELKSRWRQNNDYRWICNQFKSIRQDLTVSLHSPEIGALRRFASYKIQVQRIRTEFTVQVYEIHARMALEAVSISFHSNEISNLITDKQADMVEYNQCQAMLKTLYEHENITGCNEEFTAYRILLLLHGMNRSGAMISSLYTQTIPDQTV